jgi:hypothetical protein
MFFSLIVTMVTKFVSKIFTEIITMVTKFASFMKSFLVRFLSEQTKKPSEQTKKQKRGMRKSVSFADFVDVYYEIYEIEQKSGRRKSI